MRTARGVFLLYSLCVVVRRDLCDGDVQTIAQKYVSAQMRMVRQLQISNDSAASFMAK